ncbi:MAG: isoprenylcysteine carboxylmethyltransferase family protein [Thaumarchaeota archaeon]|nr:isoprenylcysteine carboxylmethyltransferase family protein [Nitrososphaerota archaeon]
MPREDIGLKVKPEVSSEVLLLGATFVASVVFGSLILAYVLDYLLNNLFGVRTTIDITYYVRPVGLFSSGTGIAFLLWVFRHRNPRDVFISSCLTIKKFFREGLIEEPLGRTEPFTPLGPHRFVRNPMYFGAVAFAYGLGVAFESVAFLLWGVLMTLWFWFVWIPFEEKELFLLFGEQYREYQKQVPKLFPYGRIYGGTAITKQMEP